MNENLPKIIKEVGFDFWWDNPKIWKLEVPLEKMNIEELTWHFDIPFWSFKDNDYNLEPIKVINDPAKYPEHYQRIMNSNLDYPLDIMFNKGRWLFLDGLHRLAKAKIMGIKEVKVRKIDRAYIDRIKK